MHQVISWLTSFETKKLQEQISEKATFETLFRNAPLLTGVICGYRTAEIEGPLTQQLRYLDKLVHELTKDMKARKDPARFVILNQF